MTKRQMENTIGMVKFANNINKLSLGRSTEFSRVCEDGSTQLVGKVRCDTVGERPRQFMVTNSDMIPVGRYTLKGIQRNIFDRQGFVR